MALRTDQLWRSIDSVHLTLQPGPFGSGFLARLDRYEIVGTAILSMESQRHDEWMFVTGSLVKRHHLAPVAVGTIRQIVSLITEKLKHHMSGRVDVERVWLQSLVKKMRYRGVSAFWFYGRDNRWSLRGILELL